VCACAFVHAGVCMRAHVRVCVSLCVWAYEHVRERMCMHVRFPRDEDSAIYRTDLCVLKC
jgi:hypothetical protein